MRVMAPGAGKRFLIVMAILIPLVLLMAEWESRSVAQNGPAQSNYPLTLITGTAAPSGNCAAVNTVYMQIPTGTTANCPVAGQSWVAAPILPAGMLGFVVTGTCPTGWTEVAALNGLSAQFTLAANGDVGTQTGNASITPTSSWPGQVPTFTGTQINFGTALNVSLLGVGTALTGPASITPAGTVAWPAQTPTISAVNLTPLSMKVIPCAKS